jgi:hypothetical protein
MLAESSQDLVKTMAFSRLREGDPEVEGTRTRTADFNFAGLYILQSGQPADTIPIRPATRTEKAQTVADGRSETAMVRR